MCAGVQGLKLSSIAFVAAFARNVSKVDQLILELSVIIWDETVGSGFVYDTILLVPGIYMLNLILRKVKCNFTFKVLGPDIGTQTHAGKN